MRIVFERPPLFDLINAKFHIAGRPVIFAWGDIIYNPQRMPVPSHLMAHESVHGQRQGSDIEGWWHHYIDDPGFRLAEEILGHRAEYRHLLEQCSNRHARRTYLKQTAKRLSSPLYGGVVTAAKARGLLLAAA